MISFGASYTHIHHVLTAWSEVGLVALTLPLAIDFLMLLAGAALIAMHAPKPATRRRRPATTTRSKPALAVAS